MEKAYFLSSLAGIPQASIIQYVILQCEYCLLTSKASGKLLTTTGDLFKETDICRIQGWVTHLRKT